MSSNVAPSAKPFPVGTKPKLFADAIQAAGSLFQHTAPAELDTVVHRLWLLALVCTGALVRFWGLGSVGLHGDEETMGMAVKGILAYGVPLLPSDMFYPRGMTQLYLMAGSVALFGENEWALRLPSVLCGIALIPIAHWAGRRFLRPEWNLAFAASVALLPALIDYSQTARMYIFLVASVMASMACLFHWEHSGRVRWLVAATAALIWGLDMHVLAVAAVLMFLVPGLVRGDFRKLAFGAGAALTVVLAYALIELWLNSHYPTPAPDFAEAVGTPPMRPSAALRDFSQVFDFALWTAGAVIAVLAWRVGRLVRGATASICATGLLFAGIALQVALYYHPAAILYLAGIVVAIRHRVPRIGGRLATLMVAVCGLALVHFMLVIADAGTFMRTVGALIGQPSVWQYVRIAQLSPIAGLTIAALLAWGLYQLAHRQRAADYWLLAVLGVCVPLFVLGAFAWNVPPRYTAMSLAPLLLCAFATVQHAADFLVTRASAARRARWGALAATIGALGVINPAAAAATINSGYRTHPDHKGAAEFMRTQGITDEDIVLAEDVLQQTYYLGRVDYWLIGSHVARRFVVRTKQGIVDFYTHTPVIVSTAMLDELLHKHQDKRVFVIGTGEGWMGGRRPVREELHAALESDRFERLYTGRDGLTRVLRAVPGAVSASGATRVKSTADKAALAEEAVVVPMRAKP